MQNQRFKLCVMCIFSLLFCWSCTRVINTKIEKIGNLPTPLIEPLPLTAGVYYGKDFCNYKLSHAHEPISSVTIIYNAQLGKANVSLFDYILSNSFKKVIPIKHLPEGHEDFENIDVIIEPTVNDFSPWLPNYLSYEMKFYLPDGKVINWLIKGTSKKTRVLLTSNAVKKETQVEMRNIAAQFMTGFCKQKEIQKHFYKQCN